MATIRHRIAGRDRELFVARQQELAYFDAVLTEQSPHRVVHVVGPGGIGKSALLREVSRRAEAKGFDTIWLDGRDLPPFPTEVDASLGRLAETSPSLVVFDSYELIGSLDSHLRAQVIPDLPDTTIVVFASRQHPSRGWYEGGWDAVVHTIELGALTPVDAYALARSHGVVDDDDIAELVGRSHGSPLALVVGAEAGPSSTASELAQRLLGDEVDASRYRILSVAAIARVTTPELLGDVLGDGDPHDSFKWLADRSFSEPLIDGLTLHALVAEAVRDQLRDRDPNGEAALRRRIADHLHRRAVAGQSSLSTDLQHLVVDPTVRWGFSSTGGSRYRIDSIRPGDADSIGAILAAVGMSAWWETTRVFFDEHPECCGVARDRDGLVGGYYVAVSPGNAPAAAERDPMLGPWLRYARDRLLTSSAVLWREAVDLTGEMGEITSLLGAGGLFSTGVANPRYGFLPIAPEIPAASAFARALDAKHVPELDFRDLGVSLDCHIVDFGPGGLVGNQRDWIYRETGVVPPTETSELDPGRLIRLLREPGGLTHGPTFLGGSPSERLQRLRGLIEEALSVFGDHRDDQLARTIVEAAYLGEAAPHEAIARNLNLSRSAYFRRLQQATERVGQEIAATVQRRA